MWVHKKQQGFTIVELLIVIVVIAILAAITTVAFSGIQARARDSTRTNDMASIMKAMELYKVDKGVYPLSSGADSPGTGTNVPAGYTSNAQYGYSYATNDSWLRSLVVNGYLAKAPKDPVNNDVQYYRLFVYANGIGAECPEPVYALMVMRYEQASNIPATTTTDLRNTCPTASAAFRTTTAQALFSNVKN